MSQQQQNNGRQNALADYVEVNVRIEKFWDKWPEGRIDTQIVSWENGVVVMKASVYRNIIDQFPSATGTAYEKEGSSFINKTSALENCETSAVGRALAILGFEIKKNVASKEEVENAKLNQKREDKGEPVMASGKQVGMIKALALQIGKLKEKTDKEVLDLLPDYIGEFDSLNSITKAQGMKAIELLTGWKEKYSKSA